jgi:predicted Rossmann-fold nucleotide-binding protein
LLFYINIKSYPKAKNPFDLEFEGVLKDILKFLEDKEISTGFIFKNIGNLKAILSEISKVGETVVKINNENRNLLLLCDQDFWDQKYKYGINLNL